MKFRAAIYNGKLNINRDKLRVFLSHKKNGTLLDIEIVERKPKKSNPLRKYYFGIALKTWMDEVGYERNELDNVHTELKKLYFNCKPDKRGFFTNIPSVFSNESDLDVSQKKAFVDWFIRMASKDVYIPDPEGAN